MSRRRSHNNCSTRGKVTVSTAVCPSAACVISQPIQGCPVHPECAGNITNGNTGIEPFDCLTPLMRDSLGGRPNQGRKDLGLRSLWRLELFMEDAMRAALRVFAVIVMFLSALPRPVLAQPAPEPRQPVYTPGELVNTGHRFFGSVSSGLATLIERAVGQWGLPNGYVLGEEAGGAFFGGLRYGEGMLYTKNAGDLKVFWQGPSLGWDFGGDGARTMMLVYSLPATQAIYQRFAGISGSAYFVGGFGMTALTANDVVLVPIRSGVGLRLGANVGYLKFTPQSTWNPF
jgi:hypothetical protein